MYNVPDFYALSAVQVTCKAINKLLRAQKLINKRNTNVTVAFMQTGALYVVIKWEVSIG